MKLWTEVDEYGTGMMNMDMIVINKLQFVVQVIVIRIELASIKKTLHIKEKSFSHDNDTRCTIRVKHLNYIDCETSIIAVTFTR